MARLKQNIETPLTERIEEATWPEVLAYISTAAMDSRYAGPELERAYRYSFRKYLDEWTAMNPDRQPEPICNEPCLNSYELDKIEELRRGIKRDRDRWFIEERYDELEVEGVPKSFWQDGIETRKETDGMEVYSQSALDEF